MKDEEDNIGSREESKNEKIMEENNKFTMGSYKSKNRRGKGSKTSIIRKGKRKNKEREENIENYTSKTVFPKCISSMRRVQKREEINEEVDKDAQMLQFINQFEYKGNPIQLTKQSLHSELANTDKHSDEKKNIMKVLGKDVELSENAVEFINESNRECVKGEKDKNEKEYELEYVTLKRVIKEDKIQKTRKDLRIKITNLDKEIGRMLAQKSHYIEILAEISHLPIGGEKAVNDPMQIETDNLVTFTHQQEDNLEQSIFHTMKSNVISNKEDLSKYIIEEDVENIERKNDISVCEIFKTPLQLEKVKENIFTESENRILQISLQSSSPHSNSIIIITYYYYIIHYRIIELQNYRIIELYHYNFPESVSLKTPYALHYLFSPLTFSLSKYRVAIQYLPIIIPHTLYIYIICNRS